MSFYIKLTCIALIGVWSAASAGDEIPEYTYPSQNPTQVAVDALLADRAGAILSQPARVPYANGTKVAVGALLAALVDLAARRDASLLARASKWVSAGSKEGRVADLKAHAKAHWWKYLLAITALGIDHATAPKNAGFLRFMRYWLRARGEGFSPLLYPKRLVGLRRYQDIKKLAPTAWISGRGMPVLSSSADLEFDPHGGSVQFAQDPDKDNVWLKENGTWRTYVCPDCVIRSSSMAQKKCTRSCNKAVKSDS